VGINNPGDKIVSRGRGHGAPGDQGQKKKFPKTTGGGQKKITSWTPRDPGASFFFFPTTAGGCGGLRSAPAVSGGGREGNPGKNPVPGDCFAPGGGAKKQPPDQPGGGGTEKKNVVCRKIGGGHREG